MDADQLLSSVFCDWPTSIIAIAVDLILLAPEMLGTGEYNFWNQKDALEFVDAAKGKLAGGSQ